MPYIKCILPLKINWEPYYSTDSGLSVGMRVRVLFSRKEYVAVVSQTGVDPEIDQDRILPVLSIEEGLERITEEEISFWRFLSGYYLCTVGEVYKTAYPEFRTESERKAAEARERGERMRAKKVAALELRLEKLRIRLGKKESELRKRLEKANDSRAGKKVAEAAAKRGAEITAELTEEKHGIEEQIKLTEDSIRRISVCEKLSDCLGEVRCVPLHDGLARALNRGVSLIQGTDRLSGYISLAASVLASEKDVLYLVPEIVFSERLSDRMEEAFPGRVLRFHSHETIARRREVAALLRREGQGRLVLGTRSALFLPFTRLGLVIVDEEHDSSYKQESPAPCYMARDAAIMLASIHQCPAVLGSATPSLESIHNCIIGKFRNISLNQAIESTDIEVIDTTAEKRKNGMKGELSRKLLEAADQRPEAKLLFIIPWNPSEELKTEISEHIARPHDIISTHAAKKTNLAGYTLIALLHAEFLLKKEDFRADEHTLQLIGQLRSRSEGAKIVIQTAQGQHPVFTRFLSHYDGPSLLQERKAFSFPPYTRMIDVKLKDSNEARLEKLSRMLAEKLPVQGMGPYPDDSFRNDGSASRIIRILLPKDRNIADQKKSIHSAIINFENEFKYPGHISIDVDPV